MTRGIALAAAVAALAACHQAHEPQTANDPIGGTPKVQQPITTTAPQKPFDPVARVMGEGDSQPSQKPFNTPTPQEPQFADPQPQRPFPDVISGANAKEARASDGDILAAARALNEGEIEAAEVAKKNAHGAAVKQFASMLVTHHRDEKAKEQRVEQKAKITAKDSALSKHIQQENRSELDALKETKGEDFDTAFLDSQIKAHQSALHTIDDSLAPAAQNPEVKNHVAEMRRTVEEHLSQAESIKANLEENAKSTTTTTSGHVKAKHHEAVKKDDTNKK